jgi:integral membrane protein (TIGR01906 family)
MAEIEGSRTKEIFGNVKQENKFLYYFLVISIIIIIILFILLANYKNTIYNLTFYKYEYEKNGVYNKFSKAIVDNATIDLFLYLNNNQKNITSQFFSERDKLHLIDVKHLIKISKVVYTAVLISLIVLIFVLFYYWKNVFKKSLAKIFIISSLLYIILFAVTALNQTNESFQKKFTDLHYVLFDNDYWILNPEKDNLINMFPQQFWYDIAQKIIRDALLYAVLILIIGINIFIYLHLKNKFLRHKTKNKALNSS